MQSSTHSVLMESSINDLIQERGFIRESVAPDGNCFFNALVLALSRRGCKTSMTALRLMASIALIERKAELLPFFDVEGAGLVEEEYLKGARAVRRSKCWDHQMVDLVVGLMPELLEVNLTIFNVGDDGEITEYETLVEGANVDVALLRIDDNHFDVLLV